MSGKDSTPSVDWTARTLAAGKDSLGNPALYARNTTTGELDLYTSANPAAAIVGSPATTPQVISTSGFTATSAPTLTGADINTDGQPDLWTTGVGTNVTANILQTATLTATTTAVSFPAHEWPLTEGSDTTATDAENSQTSATVNPTNWGQDDTRGTDLQFTGSGNATTAAAAITTSGDFTVSAWVKPTAPGGTVLAQDNSNTVGFKLWAEPSDNSWRAAMPTSNIAAPTWNTAISAPNSVQYNMWTQVVVTYDHTHGALTVYVDGTEIAAVGHTAVAAAVGGFQIGGSAHATWFNGQISTVATWNQVVPPAQPAIPASFYVPVPATRFLDTRTGIGIPGNVAGPVGPGSITRLKIAGTTVGSATIPATGITAVAINLGVVSPDGNHWLTTYPDGTTRPVASVLNYTTVGSPSNFVIVPVGPDGYIDIWNSAGTTHLLGDVSGYYTSDAAASGDSTYTPLAAPSRVLDTRSGTGGVPVALLTNGQTVNVTVTGGTTQVPTNASAIAVKFTSVNATTTGYIKAWAYSGTQPGASVLNYVAGVTGANLTIVPIGTSGKISINNAGGSTNLIADVSGYYTAGIGGQKYHAINITRMIDTCIVGGAIPATGLIHLPQGATTTTTSNPSLIVNITAIGPAASGYLTAYTDGVTRPVSNDVSFPAAATVATASIVPAGTAGIVDIWNSSSATVQVAIDCYGYFSAN